MKTLIFALTLGLSVSSHAENYKYGTLIIKDYDEMNSMVNARIQKSHAAAEATSDESAKTEVAVEPLRDALKLTFSRPNNDNMIAKLTPDIRRELMAYSAYEKTIQSLIDEAISQTKDKKELVSVQSTALFILENILSEIRPEAFKNAQLRKSIQSIADAKIELSKAVINDRKVRSMFLTKNPSEEAQKVLKEIPKENSKSDNKKKESAD